MESPKTPAEPVNIASWPVLRGYAKELGEAMRSGDPKRIEEARIKHDEYHDICLKADRVEVYDFSPAPR